MDATTQPKQCSMCKSPATRLVDGEPSCDAHAGKLYEHQVEDYIASHEKDNEWLDLMSELN